MRRYTGNSIIMKHSHPETSKEKSAEESAMTKQTPHMNPQTYEQRITAKEIIKRVFGHMWTEEAQISLRVCAFTVL